MTFDEMQSCVERLRKLIEKTRDGEWLAENEAVTLLGGLIEIQSALREYGSLHHTMAPRILRRGYIEAKQ